MPVTGLLVFIYSVGPEMLSTFSALVVTYGARHLTCGIYFFVELAFKVFGEQKIGMVSDDSGTSRGFCMFPIPPCKNLNVKTSLIQ